MYDPLFLALAQAKSQPSHAFRTAMSALDIPGQAAEGYDTGLKLRNDILANKYAPQLMMAQRQAALLDNYGKLSESIGPDRAIQLMGPALQSAGVDTSKLSSTGPGGTPYTPQELEGMGKFGQGQLTARKTALDLENNAPYTADQVRGMLASNPGAADALIKAFPDGNIPSRVVQNAIQGLSANRLQGLIATRQFQLLPSQSGPNTAAGAAYQVKVAARQGKSLIAKATTPQAIALASADLSRAVQRAAPVAETIGAGNFAQSLPTLWSQFQQKITSDPNGPDVPKMRKALYDQFNELDQAATPWIANHLQNMEDSGTASTFGGNWNQVRNRELGLSIPDIPFQDTSAGNPNVSAGIPGQDDQSAVSWLKANPNHPMAAAVAGKLRSKGIQF